MELGFDLTPIYLTTAINYTNGPPHIGHAYEAILADIIARYHRSVGRQVYFLTGTDEHGQKIAKTAFELQLTPQELCDQNQTLFQNLNEKLGISNDYFIRTTNLHHKKIAQEVFEKIYEKGDIYLGVYQGFYSSREERYITEIEAASTNGIDPISKQTYQILKEPSYFFKLETYREKLRQHIENNPAFILNDHYRNDLLNKLLEPLKDLSISRTSFDWGIPVPKIDENNQKHILYVWFDALTNYLSGSQTVKNRLKIPCSSDDKFNWGLFGAPIHIIGQDILWFHAVIWSCMLMSLEIPLPKSILVHGFITDAQGLKMSKSIGNVIDPNYLLEKYSSDTLRYYLIRGGNSGTDLRFSYENLTYKNNCELADYFGNLVNRCLQLTKDNCHSKIPSVIVTEETINMILLKQIDEHFLNGNLSQALELISSEIRNVNRWLTEKAPWKLNNPIEKQIIIRCLLEKIYILTILLEPFIPKTTKIIFDRFGYQSTNLSKIQNINLPSDSIIDCSKLILFNKL
jgi:methionyl-tRNA synthetase